MLRYVAYIYMQHIYIYIYMQHVTFQIDPKDYTLVEA